MKIPARFINQKIVLSNFLKDDSTDDHDRFSPEEERFLIWLDKEVRVYLDYIFRESPDRFHHAPYKLETSNLGHIYLYAYQSNGKDDKPKTHICRHRLQ